MYNSRVIQIYSNYILVDLVALAKFYFAPFPGLIGWRRDAWRGMLQRIIGKCDALPLCMVECTESVHNVYAPAWCVVCMMSAFRQYVTNCNCGNHYASMASYPCTQRMSVATLMEAI